MIDIELPQKNLKSIFKNCDDKFVKGAAETAIEYTNVFKNGKKLATIGALGMNDYPTYLEKEKKGYFPKGYAKERRKLYKQRHEKDRHKTGTNGWYADKILW